MTEPKQIATLPPIEELRNDVPRSPRTGEPRRPAVLLVASTLLYLAAVAVGVGYAQHWWLAVHPDTYPASAHLIEWVDPDPGKWLSLTLEGALAAAAVAAAGAAGVVGHQTWNGWRWARWAVLVAFGIIAGWVVITNSIGYIALIATAIATSLLFTPPVSEYLDQWDQVRGEVSIPYHRPDSIIYGRLSRFH